VRGAGHTGEIRHGLDTSPVASEPQSTKAILFLSFSFRGATDTRESPGTDLIAGKIVIAAFIIIGVIAAPRDPSRDWESFALAIGKEGMKEGPCSKEITV